ncbi:histidine phosphatase family protein [Conexibacter arvalis]|uniref:Putative phosphoglycerate mutase n=1 Tax=Conexibacter arvalis TaxID=912552 RepID=A0A840IMQ4_9ACTN|nr:histidine phosphatase family protein [Conexibacter arvalis]MBB4665248.1 putative phosphoglycerate mutase [Conexibacter arvalis]
MAKPLNELWLVRHGETAWTVSRQHTGETDIPLTENGERDAAGLAPRLARERFALVLASPLARARRTAELAGFGPDRVELEPDLRELDYGDYEGLTTVQIRERRPGWDLWRDGCPGGESIADVAARAARVVARARAADGPVLLFAHGHLLRTLAAVALELDPNAGRHLVLDPGTISIIGHEHEWPALKRWNDASEGPGD